MFSPSTSWASDPYIQLPIWYLQLGIIRWVKLKLTSLSFPNKKPVHPYLYRDIPYLYW